MSDKDKQAAGAFDRYSGEEKPVYGEPSPVKTETAPARGKPAEPVVGAVQGSGADDGGSGAGAEDYDVDPQAGGGRVGHRH